MWIQTVDRVNHGGYNDIVFYDAPGEVLFFGFT